MVDAHGWLWIRSRFPTDGSNPANIDYLYGGAVGTQTIAAYADWSFELEGEAEEFKVLKPVLFAGRHETRRRLELIPDERWQSPRCRSHVRRMGFESFMYSLFPLAEHEGTMITSGVILLRGIGASEFEPRDAKLTHLVIQECGTLHTDELNMQRVEDVANLTPRQRSVLALLIDGMSHKLAAAHLELSPHTVNDHIKAIDKHFDVQSRAELMRKLMSGG